MIEYSTVCSDALKINAEDFRSSRVKAHNFQKTSINVLYIEKNLAMSGGNRHRVWLHWTPVWTNVSKYLNVGRIVDTKQADCQLACVESHIVVVWIIVLNAVYVA